jgi:hypothetical protein
MNSRITNLKGDRGGIYITDTSAHTGDFDAITALEATVVAELVSNTITGTLTSVPIPSGATIYGRFSSIDLASGKVFAYNRC